MTSNSQQSADRRRLIAIDLDGTLLGRGGSLSPATVAAVAGAHRAGHLIAIATGRPPDLAISSVGALAGSVGHVVGANGTIVTTFPASSHERPQLLHVSGFDVAVAVELVEQLRRHDAGLGFALATDHGFAHEDGFGGRMPAVVDSPPVDDVLQLGGSTAYKLLAFHIHRSVDELLVELPPLLHDVVDGFSVRHMGADAVEIGPDDIDKCAGVQWLCAHLGIDAHDVIAIGDERNDTRMVEWAGHGVAVANADPALLDVADEVIAANDADGVAQFLARLQ